MTEPQRSRARLALQAEACCNRHWRRVSKKVGAQTWLCEQSRAPRPGAVTVLLGGLIEFYRSPARVAWTPTGTHMPDPKLAQLWWTNVAEAVTGEKTSDPSKWLSDSHAPWKKLANEKPKGETITYDKLLQVWRDGKLR